MIATGSRRRAIAIPGLQPERLLTNESLFELERAPGHLAIGRVPNVEGFEAAVEAGPDGIRVDGWGRTSASGVWAVGDVTPVVHQTHAANALGRRIVQRIALPSGHRPRTDRRRPPRLRRGQRRAAHGATRGRDRRRPPTRPSSPC